MSARRRRTPEERLRAAQQEVLMLEGQVESRRRTRDTRRKIILGGALLARARTAGVERNLCETLVAEQTGGREQCFAESAEFGEWPPTEWETSNADVSANGSDIRGASDDDS